MIITESGDAIEAYNVEIGPSTVFYTVTSDPNSATKRIALSEVMVIKYENGKKWMPGSGDAQSAAPSQAAPEAPGRVGESVNYSDATANAAALTVGNPADVRFTGKAEEKPAGQLLLIYKVTPGSTLADKNIEYHLVTRYDNSAMENKSLAEQVTSGRSGQVFTHPGVDIVITNRSDGMVYIDLGNTFFICNGESMRYYVPTATTSTTSSTTGASVNLGAVAGALGVGGPVGILASGVNVGGANTNTNSTTVFSERILALPPCATEVIKGACFSNYGEVKTTGRPVGMAGRLKNLSLKRPKDEMYHIGETVSDFDKSMFHDVSAIISYSLAEEMTNPVQLRSTYLPEKIIASKVKKVFNVPLIDDECISENFNDTLYMYMLQIDK